MRHYELTDQVICCFYNVYNKLGYGFLEKVYENALAIELENAGLSHQPQAPVKVYYGKELVGEYVADLVVECKVIVEIKAAKSLTPAHEAQLVNYLKATEIEVGLLLNFGPTAEVKRKIFDNHRK